VQAGQQITKYNSSIPSKTTVENVDGVDTSNGVRFSSVHLLSIDLVVRICDHAALDWGSIQGVHLDTATGDSCE
jgi:hypothetical protein